MSLPSCRLIVSCTQSVPIFLQIIFLPVIAVIFFIMSMNYDLPPLDRDTRFALWKVKTRAILTQSEVDDALDKFGNKDSNSWTEEEKGKDHKALTQIQLHLSNNILKDVLQEKTVASLWLKLESICMS